MNCANATAASLLRARLAAAREAASAFEEQLHIALQRVAELERRLASVEGDRS